MAAISDCVCSPTHTLFSNSANSGSLFWQTISVSLCSLIKSHAPVSVKCSKIIHPDEEVVQIPSFSKTFHILTFKSLKVSTEIMDILSA